MDLISEVGKRPCSSGHTIIYNLNLQSISALEPTDCQIVSLPVNIEAAHHRGVQEVHPIYAIDKRQEVHDVHPTSATDAPQEVHDVHPNHPLTIQEPSAAAAASTDDLEFEKFLSVHPRPKDLDVSRKPFDALIVSGVKISDFLKAAQNYADQQKGQVHRWIAGSDKWLRTRGYEDALRSASNQPGCDQDSKRVKLAARTQPKPWQNWPSLLVREGDGACFTEWQEWSSANGLGDLAAWPVAKGSLVMLPSRWPPTSDEGRSQKTIDWLLSLGGCLESCVVAGKITYLPKTNLAGFSNDHV
ncbi:hypothetical protein O4H61_09070 [Roseovarius aestuarii]|nr:hypothetical protein [Roseovarius aestuarii]